MCDGCSGRDLDLPQNFGLGLANRTLMDGRLLVGADVLYRLWNETDLFGALHDNQWAVRIGGQFSAGRYRLRAGLTWRFGRGACQAVSAPDSW